MIFWEYNTSLSIKPLFLTRYSRINPFPVLVSSVDPDTVAGGEGVASHVSDVAYGIGAEGIEFVA